MFAHIGGRYADIKMAHDARLERSVEVHSDWGTFEWLLHDALEQGYRVGILANSDGHKGRHGASHPGASLFGAYGGLSCLLAPELTPGRAVRGAAPPPSLCDDRLPTAARYASRVRRQSRKIRRRPAARPDDIDAGTHCDDGRHPALRRELRSNSRSRHWARRRSSGSRSATGSTCSKPGGLIARPISDSVSA